MKKNAAHNAHINIAKTLSRIKDFVIFKNNKDLDAAKKAIFSYEAEIEKSFDTIEKHFSGDKQKLDNARHLFKQWKSIRNRVIALQELGEVDEAVDLMFKGEGAQHVAKLEKAVEKLHHFMDHEADNFFKKASSAALNSLWVSIAMVIVLLFGGWITFAISRNIAKNVTLALGIADAVASGNLSDHIECDSQTEAGQLLQTFDTMQAQLIESSHEVEKMETHLHELEEEKRIAEKEKRIAEEEKRIAEKALRHKNALDNVFGSFLEDGKEAGEGDEGEEELISEEQLW
jgi:methyl-accepting chemotaxis protein